MVWDWKKANNKWLRKKKKVKKQEIIEIGAGGEKIDGSKARIIERLCENFKPTVLLSDDGNLQHKNQFRSAMEKYTRYNQAVFKDLSEGLYFDIFCSLCDQDMRTKLVNIKGIEKMSQENIWEQVEVMFLTSNPMYMRRIQAMETCIIKGETVSDYFNRLKNSFQEADMQKASIGTVMISLLIGSLPVEGNEGKIKSELLKIYSETPNPSEEDLQKFRNITGGGVALSGK